MRRLAPIDYHEPQEATFRGVSHGGPRLTRGRKGNALAHLEVSNSLALVQQLWEATHGLGLTVPTLYRDGPTDIDPRALHARHSDPRGLAGLPSQRRARARRGHPAIYDFGANRPSFGREEVGIDRSQHRGSDALDHAGHELSAFPPRLSRLRLQDVQHDIAALVECRLDQMHGPRAQGRPQVPVQDARGDSFRANRVRLDNLEDRRWKSNVEPRRRIRGNASRHQRSQRQQGYDKSGGTRQVRPPVDPSRPPVYLPALMTRPSMSSPISVPSVALPAAVILALICVPSAINGQSAADDSGVRIGVSVGGVGTMGLVLEFFDGNRSLDLTLGTWAFQDLSLSIAVKQYFGAKAARPFVGAGLWLVAAKPSDGRLGLAAVLRAPVGVDWNLASAHSLGASLNVSRALWVRRTDPEDELPLTGRWVPLPGIYYRFEPS